MLEGQTIAEAKPEPPTKPHAVKLTSTRMRSPHAPQKETAVSERDPVISQANGILQNRITQLTGDIGIESGKKLGAFKMMQHRKRLSELQGLQFALKADGTLSPFLKKAELTRLTAETQDPTARNALDAIEPKAKQASIKFYEILRKHGIGEDIIAAIDRDPGSALTTDKTVIKSLSKLPLQQYFFASGPPSDTQIGTMTARLKPEQQAALDEEEKENGKKGKMSLLLLFLMAPFLLIKAALETAGKKMFGGGGQ